MALQIFIVCLKWQGEDEEVVDEDILLGDDEDDEDDESRSWRR